MLPNRRTIRQIAYDIEQSSRRVRDELTAHLADLEADGRGNSNLAWRIRDYIEGVKRLADASNEEN